MSTAALNLAQLLRAPHEALVVRLHAELAAAGFDDIRPAHGCVFQYAASAGSRLTDLAQQAGLTKPTVVAAINDLERLGYVERIADPQDGRAKLVRLTARGVAARQEAERIIGGIEADWRALIGARRAAELRRALEDLHRVVWPPAGG